MTIQMDPAKVIKQILKHLVWLLIKNIQTK